MTRTASGQARTGSLNPSSWIVWAMAAASAGLLLRNPWYVLGLAAIVVLVGWRSTGEPPGRGMVLLAGGIVVSSTLINLLFSRAGDTVLLRLPLGWIGGPYTLEALLFGITAGLQVAAVLLVMGVFSRSLTSADLLRRTPPGLYPVGVAATLGLSFAPHARQAFIDLREARQLRGAPAPGWREAPRLLTPMVVVALERALAQAEALAARGWARETGAGGERWQAGLTWLAIAAAVLVCAARPEWAALAAGLMVAGLAVARLARAYGGLEPRPVRDRWTRRDTLVAGLAIGAALGLLILAGQDLAGTSYYPYPTAHWPSLRLAPLMALAVLAAPAAWGSA